MPPPIRQSTSRGSEAVKQAVTAPSDSPEVGEAYVFVDMASASKLVISYRVGKRDDENTRAFIADLRARLMTIPQLYSDGWQELVTAALAETPTEPPKPKALKLPEQPAGTPTAPARALPNGRGFLRLVGSVPAAPVAPTPAPEPPPSEPPPAPRRMVQLSLFGEPDSTG